MRTKRIAVIWTFAAETEADCDQAIVEWGATVLRGIFEKGMNGDHTLNTDKEIHVDVRVLRE